MGIAVHGRLGGAQKPAGRLPGALPVWEHFISGSGRGRMNLRKKKLAETVMPTWGRGEQRTGNKTARAGQGGCSIALGHHQGGRVDKGGNGGNRASALFTQYS